MSKVLLVDADPTLRTAVNTALGEYFELLTASDAGAGWQKFRHYKPYLVILDSSLEAPGDGLALLGAIKSVMENHVDHVVAVVGTDPGGASGRLAAEYGADIYFAKPVQPEALRSWVRQQFERRTSSSLPGELTES